MELAELTVRGFTEEIASASPAPGGGSAAALAGAVGAAAVQGAESAVELTLSLAGPMIFYSALLEVMERSGLTEKLSRALRPVLGRLAERYEKYAARFASELHCELQEIAPYVYFAITTVTDYMIFGEVSYIEPQIRLIKSTIRSILEKDDTERTI